MGHSATTGSRVLHRLLLLLAVIVVPMAALAAQSARLTIAQGEIHRQNAEARLVRRVWTQTVRGSIRDRLGRVLAHDRPCFDVAVDYTVVTGEWAERQAARAARRAADNWAAMSRGQRQQAIEALIPGFRAREDRTWALIAEQTGLSRAEIDARRFAVQDEVRRLARYVRARREERELIAYAGTLGISRDQLLRQADAVDRPDLDDPAARLRHILAQAITDEAERAIDKNVSEQLAEETTPHVIAPSVDDEVGFSLRRAAAERDPERADLPMYPGLAVLDSGLRDYPMSTQPAEIDLTLLPPPLRREGTRTVEAAGVAGHLLGSVRRGVYREDVQRRADAVEQDPALAQRSLTSSGREQLDRGRYAAGDIVGSTGLERTLEDELRGLRGLRTDRLDGAPAQIVPAQNGRDIALTIDIALQARIQALLDPALGLASVQTWHDNTEHADADDPASPLLMPPGTPIDAAAVVLDVTTGQILAMVSTPTLSRRADELPSDPQERERYLALHRPGLDRTVGVPLPPGSIAKALIACGAHARGLLGTDERIPCTGHLLEGQPDRLRCWIYKRNDGLTHDIDLGHAPNVAEALKVSCNIFFYTLGRRLGPAGIAELYRDFGLGQPMGLPLDHAIEGWLGPLNRTEAVSEGDAILMGIGQGPVAWTPLHAADAFATIARGGVRLTPRLLLDQPPQSRDLGLDPAIVCGVLHGLDLAVNDPRGTAHSIAYRDPAGVTQRFDIFDVPGVKVWGKTGTATAPPLVIDGSVVRRGDHSWFVLLCGPGEPRYAVAVVAEYAGSGGRVSGPIANQIIHALRAQGYL